MTTPFARSGPLWPVLVREGAVNASEWMNVATWLEHELPEGANRDVRIHWLTVPLALWLKRRTSQRSPLMVGLNAPQGAGKTTLTRSLVGVFAHVFGLRAVSLSVDDFYLRREEQLALAARHAGNRCLEHRGYPGTHDVTLGASVLAALRDGRDVAVPRYDKAAHGGRGDRSSDVTWVRGRVDLVLLEGWMLGFKPVASVNDAALAVPNELLRAYDAWNSLLDVFLALRMQSVDQVVRWRIEAEQAMRASGRPGLSDAEVEDYVRRFLPAYETWRADTELSITLDAERRPVP
jgi:D-glycerate 3-kinase